MSNNYSHVLVDAKTEYTKQLGSMLIPRIYEGIQKIYDISKKSSENTEIYHLKQFQSLLSQIPKWNQEYIDEEAKRIMKVSECEWLEELITAIFVAHTKILSVIKVNNTPSRSIDLTVPSFSHFIHKCYIQTARTFWKNPFLFDDTINTCDYQRNMQICEKLISDSIDETIRKLLPVKNILREYLGDSFNHIRDDVESIISNGEKNTLRKLVRKELDNVENSKKNLDEGYSHYKIDPENESVNMNINDYSEDKQKIETFDKKSSVSSKKFKNKLPIFDETTNVEKQLEKVENKVEKSSRKQLEEIEITDIPVVEDVTQDKKTGVIENISQNKVEELKVATNPINEVTQKGGSEDINMKMNIVEELKVATNPINEVTQKDGSEDINMKMNIEKVEDTLNKSSIQFSNKTEPFSHSIKKKESIYENCTQEIDELDQLENFNQKTIRIKNTVSGTKKKTITRPRGNPIKNIDQIDDFNDTLKVNKVKSNNEIRKMLSDSIENESQSRRKKFSDVNLFQ